MPANLQFLCEAIYDIAKQRFADAEEAVLSSLERILREQLSETPEAKTQSAY